VSVFVTARSAEAAFTVVVAEAELFAAFGSDVAVVATAVLVYAPPGASGLTLMTNVMFAVAPAGNVAKLHDGAPGLPDATSAQLAGGPEFTEKLTKPVFAGGESVNATLWASDGPLFVIVIVYVMSLPAVTGSGESVFVTATSADTTTVVVAVAESFDGSGSLTPELAVAVLERTVAAVTPGPTCTVTVTLADPPFTSAPRLQLTVVVPVHDPCDATADTKEVPAGTGSVSVTFGASDGPVFETPIV